MHCIRTELQLTIGGPCVRALRDGPAPRRAAKAARSADDGTQGGATEEARGIGFELFAKEFHVLEGGAEPREVACNPLWVAKGNCITNSKHMFPKEPTNLENDAPIFGNEWVLRFGVLWQSSLGPLGGPKAENVQKRVVVYGLVLEGFPGDPLGGPWGAPGAPGGGGGLVGRTHSAVTTTTRGGIRNIGIPYTRLR